VLGRLVGVGLALVPEDGAKTVASGMRLSMPLKRVPVLVSEPSELRVT
jgi:hypothetical protein